MTLPDENLKDYSYQCPECGLHYYDEKMAKKCQNWCGQNKSCNLEIIAHSIENQKKSKG